MARRVVQVAVLLVALGLCGRAAAVPSLAEKATAQALFEDGLRLMGESKFEEACPKLAESERLDPALGTRFRLSECNQAIGRLASAWGGFLEVADLAHAAGQSERETVARARAAAIEPRLSHVKVTVAQPETPGVEIGHDGAVVGRAQWGTPLPVDPGTYAVAASAPGRTPWQGSVTIPRDGSTVTLVVPVLDVAATSPPPPPRPAPPPPPGLDARARRGFRIAGFASIGAGTAGVLAGGVLGLVAKANYDGAGPHCGATACDAAGKATIDSARQLSDVATAIFVGGAVAAVGGVVILLTVPSATKQSSPSASLRVGPGACLLEGSF